MFKHFIGKVYLLDKPLQDTPTQLELEFTEDLINSLNGQVELNEEQEKKREAFYAEMDDLLGQGVYKKVLEENLLQTFRSSKLKEIAQDMKQDIFKWNCLKNLNSPNPGIWENALYKILKQLGWTSYRHSDIVKYIMRMSDNWRCSIPELLGNKITIEEFFEIEREVSFKVSSMLNDVVCLYKLISKQDIDVSPFIAKLSHAFLPKNVYELEEYGLPRMLSKKIQTNGIINLEDSSIPLHAIITEFNSIGVENVKQNLGEKLHLFENYILDYFYDGIRSEN